MKNLKLLYFLLLFLFFLSCSTLKSSPSSTSQFSSINSTSLGNISIKVSMNAKKFETCFDIEIEVMGHTQESVYPKNWNIAWIDSAGLYHFLKLRPKEKDSFPVEKKIIIQGTATTSKWSFMSISCAPTQKLRGMKAIIMTSKIPDLLMRGPILINIKN